MHLFTLLTIALAALTHAISPIPSSVTCTTLSPSSAAACYNLSTSEHCCDSALYPATTFCSPSSQGCTHPTSPPRHATENCTTTTSSAYSFSGTSTALTSFPNFLNTTITSASLSSNLSLVSPTLTSKATANATYGTPYSSPTASGITASTGANLTYSYSYSTSIVTGRTSTSVVAPAQTGAASVLGVGMGMGMAVVAVACAVVRVL